MYVSYMIYQADHVKTARQQREEDVRTGERAAEFGRLWQSLAHPRNGGHRGFRQAPAIEMLDAEMLDAEHTACSGQCAA